MSARRGGERVLESRHLIALFLGVVMLCCVFFTLGYVMGKTQYGNSPVQAASVDNSLKPLPRGAKTANPDQPVASPDWDFYTEKRAIDVPLKSPSSSSPQVSSPVDSVSSQPSSIAVTSPVRREAPAPVATHSALPPPRFRAPRMSRNAIVLQVAAMHHEGDALAMADALQQKGFPAFVVAPSSDSFYRVQVGPFATQAIGDKAKEGLQREGFKAIYRR